VVPAFGATRAERRNRLRRDGEELAQPEALAALETAKTSLTEATEDKGGHRVKALQATRDAIEETKKGIAYDNAHKDDKK